MGILDFPRNLLGKSLSKGSLFSMVGTYAAGKLMARSREKWEVARRSSQETLLDEISAYDIGKGAGKLIKGWLRFSQAKLTPALAEKRLAALLKEMDAVDSLPEEQARSRFIVAKTLFSVEGFRLSQCRYEAYQKAAWERLRKNPAYKTLTRNDVFQGKPFQPEDLIATTHRMLLMLDDGLLDDYIHRVVSSPTQRDTADYMARLIAVTLEAESDGLGQAIQDWFETYCDFKIDQSHQREAMLNTSINTATGGLPATIGLDILNRAGKALLGHKKPTA